MSWHRADEQVAQVSHDWHVLSMQLVCDVRACEAELSAMYTMIGNVTNILN